MLRPKALSEYRPRRGFALLITILLLSFLVLLLVSLASLTRVETQVASNNQQIAQARQNALLALNIAIGELQRHLGPDQRATARADLLDAASPNPLWSGVWGNTASPDGNSPSPALLTWLVSGNENRTYDVDLTATVEFGRITTPPTAAPTRAPSTTFTAANSVELLGDGTTARTGTYATVRAPLVNIEVPAGQIPGLTGTTATPIGRYAWWADDESAKARLNLEDPHAVTNPAYSFATAQRSAIDLMATEPDPAPYAGTPIGTTAFPRTLETDKILNASQSALAAPAAQQTTLRNALRARSADFTVTAASVLADARRGGLKQDLTRILETTTPQVGPANTDLLFPAPADLPSGSPYFAGPPTWGLLRSYADLTAATLDVRTPTATQLGVRPVAAWAEIGVSVGYIGTSPSGFAQLRIFPRLVLWNPYDKPLATTKLEFGMKGNQNLTLQPAGAGILSLNAARVHTDNSGNNYFRFLVNMPEIPPGRALMFTLPASAQDQPYVAGTNQMEPGDERTVSVVAQSSTPLGKASGFASWPMSAGESHFYLRLVGSSPTPLAPLPGELNIIPPPDVLQWVPRVGAAFGSGGASGPLTFNADAAANQPIFRINAMARLGNTHTGASGLTMRWIANGSIAAPMSLRAHTDADFYNRANLYQGFMHRNLGETSTPYLTVNGSSAADIAIGQNFEPRPDGRFMLLATPRPATERPLISPADLRHAPITFIDTGPTYAIGNSLADFRILGRDTTSRPYHLERSFPTDTPSYSIFDHSFLANQTLWDRYFFSTVPAGLTAAQLGNPLPNARMQPTAGATPGNLTDHQTAAARLLVQGGFNINSTSVQAWRAMLGALHGLVYEPVGGGASGSLNRAFSRFPRPLAGANDPWLGFRELTSEQLDALAENIVRELRARAQPGATRSSGPHLTLAEFINRRLTPSNATDNDFGIKGPLQAAIDQTDRDAVTTRRLNNFFPYNADAPATPTPLPLNASSYDLEHLRGRDTSLTPALPTSSRNGYGPGFLTQGDLLAVIGSSLTARGDTFTVRTYGEVVSPLDSAVVLGRAWLEAVVQREPDYVETGDSAEIAPATLTQPDNQRFGRRFSIVSFRWLSPEDI